MVTSPYDSRAAYASATLRPRTRGARGGGGGVGGVGEEESARPPPAGGVGGGGGGGGAGSPMAAVSCTSVVPAGAVAGSARAAASWESRSVERAASAWSRSSWETCFVSVRVPPVVASGLLTWSTIGSSPLGTLSMAFAATLPDSPAATASTLTVARPGTILVPPMIFARGSVTAASVAKRTFESVATMLPAGIVLRPPVSRVVNTTVPLPFLSLSLTPLTSKTRL